MKILTGIIKGMAMSRKEALEELRNQVTPIHQHLIKLTLIDDDNKEHWSKELENIFRRLNNITIKPNNKKLSSQEIITEYLRYCDLDNHSRMIRLTLKEYCKHPQNKKQTVSVREHDTGDNHNDIINFVLQQSLKVSKDTWDSETFKKTANKLYNHYKNTPSHTIKKKELK